MSILITFISLEKRGRGAESLALLKSALLNFYPEEPKSKILPTSLRNTVSIFIQHKNSCLSSFDNYPRTRYLKMCNILFFLEDCSKDVGIAGWR